MSLCPRSLCGVCWYVEKQLFSPSLLSIPFGVVVNNPRRKHRVIATKRQYSHLSHPSSHKDVSLAYVKAHNICFHSHSNFPQTMRRRLWEITVTFFETLLSQCRCDCQCSLYRELCGNSKGIRDYRQRVHFRPVKLKVGWSSATLQPFSSSVRREGPCEARS